MNIIKADTLDLKNICIQIRKKVFVEEQKIPEKLDVLNEEGTISFLMKNSDDKYVGTIRYRIIENDIYKIERLAVLKEYRGKKYGYNLLKFLKEHILRKGNYKITLNGQKYLTRFYNEFGFKEEGNIFKIGDVDHIKLVYG